MAGKARLTEVVLKIQDLRKSYPAPSPSDPPTTVLNIEHFQLEEGEECALEGPSGTGKTTFLNVISGLLPADQGSLRLAGQELVGSSEVQRDALRARHVGYIFQSFRLLPSLTALENVLLGMSMVSRAQPERARQLLSRVGLDQRMSHRPQQLSVGQRQRVAVARALANRPRLVLADEPTGSLDPDNANSVLTLIQELCRESGAALLLVSHDPQILQAFKRRTHFSEVNRA